MKHAIKHGLLKSYLVDLCRCEQCTTAFQNAPTPTQVQTQNPLHITTRPDAPKITHGLLRTRIYHGCDCEACLRAHKKASPERIQRVKELKKYDDKIDHYTDQILRLRDRRKVALAKNQSTTAIDNKLRDLKARLADIKQKRRQTLDEYRMMRQTHQKKTISGRNKRK